MNKEIKKLTPANIQDIIESIKTFLGDEELEDKRVLSVSLMSEEILLIYKDKAGEDADVLFETKKVSNNLVVRFTIAGDEYNINNSDSPEFLVYNKLANQAFDLPVYEYDNGNNIICFTLALNNTFIKDLGFAWKYTRVSSVKFFGGVFLQIASTVINIVAALYSAKVITHMTTNNLEQLLYVSLVILGLNIIEQVTMFIVNRLYNLVAYKTLADTQKDLASAVLNVQTSTMTTKGSGYFIQRMTNDTTTFAAGLNTLMDLMIQIGNFVGTLIAILIVNRQAFLYELIVLVILYLIQTHSTKKMIQADRISRKANEHYSSFITEMVRGFTDIRTLHCEEPIRNELTSRVVDSSNKAYILTGKRFFYRMVTALASFTGTFIYMIFMIFLLGKSIITPTLAIILYNYHVRLGPNVIITIDNFADFYSRFRLSCERISAVISGIEFPKEKFGTVHKDRIEGHIEFDNVIFSYKVRNNEYYNCERILKGITLEIKPNQTVAFVGSSGCGKSTIFKLLNKLYLPSRGTIKIDGIDINDLDKDTLRGAMTFINQSPYVFHATIRENLRFVKPDLTDEEMIDACKKACIHEDIQKMDNGYDTILGEGGVDISGGQRQRLAIARGLLNNTSIFAFDEATSALDNETQAKVLEAVEKLGDEHTVLIIAHRLSTVINSDIIFFVKDGKIHASGSHEELLNTCEAYRSLYNSESKVAKDAALE